MLEQGDIFLLEGVNWFGRVTNWFQALWSRDGKASHNHAGIIVKQDGMTFETTEYETKCLNLFADHGGSIIQLWRWRGMTASKFVAGLCEVREYEGKMYPYHRYLLFAVGLAKWIHFKGVVCSELAARFLKGAGERSGFWGVSPDMLHDRFKHSPEWEIIYEGKVREMQ